MAAAAATAATATVAAEAAAETAAAMMNVESAQASRDDRDRRASTREENVFHVAFCHRRLLYEFIFSSFDSQLTFFKPFLFEGY